jgi:hypothetical protein
LGVRAAGRGHYFAKEEEVYLPILDQRLTEAEARGLFEAAKEAKASSR